MLLEKVRDCVDQRPREEHPRLRGIDADVVEDHLELLPDELRRQLMDGRDRCRVLSRQGHDRAHSVTAGAREGLQVGLDPGSTAGIRRRDRETTRN
jgi:hypothetical protein